MNPNDENEVIGPRTPNEIIAYENVELVEEMRKLKGSKWAKDVQEKKQKGHRSP